MIQSELFFLCSLVKLLIKHTLPSLMSVNSFKEVGDVPLISFRRTASVWIKPGIREQFSCVKAQYLGRLNKGKAEDSPLWYMLNLHEARAKLLLELYVHADNNRKCQIEKSQLIFQHDINCICKFTTCFTAVMWYISKWNKVLWGTEKLCNKSWHEPEVATT